ncbi:VOC family protein [Fulvivirgaceae bacterium BMA10]|uniref:VOC family protein n=1 Tax=Splendidivirga corallicola TaxID=3051826 RepID=A0ABT8KLK0_9BACT|nr:VOC family protein [Fulvivirgaceae bacterium BMA10]
MTILQIKESCLYVKDLDKAKSFYHDQLGFEVIGYQANRHIFFRVGSTVLLCFVPETTRKESQLPPHYAIGKQHIAFEVMPGEYKKWENKILKLGISIIHEQSWKHGLKSFYFHDPEGHLLEIVPQGIWD